MEPVPIFLLRLEKKSDIILPSWALFVCIWVYLYVVGCTHTCVGVARGQPRLLCLRHQLPLPFSETGTLTGLEHAK